MQIKSNIAESGTNGHSVESMPAAKNVTSDVALSGVSREFHDFITDIERLLKEMASLTGEELARTKAKLSVRVAVAKEFIEEMGGAITNRSRHTLKITDNYVHAQPWQAIGVGTALGLLAGFVLARRR